MPDTSFVIVGGGLAGAKAAEALREQGFDGLLTLIGAEPHLPYERPPLSKGYLLGSSPREEMQVHDQSWYDEHGVDVRTGSTAVGIDARGHSVVLDDGVPVRYDKLLLATGSRARRLDLPGVDADGVLTLRTVEDSDAVSAAIAGGKRIALVGGGWIGMEIAAAARQGGAEVTVLETAPLPLLAVLGPELARVFLDLHQEHGVDFRLAAQVSEIRTSNGSVTGIGLRDGSTVEADAVVLGVGAAPNVELAVDAGLEVDNGVLVDEALQASDPDILAVGDIANHQHPVLGRRVRVEHWANALTQPTAAAATMRGDRTPYRELPYFFTDQYDLGMEYVGHVPAGATTRVVTRGDVAAREFVAFWLDPAEHVLAGMNVNVWDVVDDVKALITSGATLSADRLADPAVPLADLVD